jgi:hypothetical protein
MDLQAFRKEYPEYNSWSDQRLSKAIEKKHAAEGIPRESKGWAGIGEDIGESLSNVIPNTMKMAPEFAAGAGGAVKNIFTHPLRSAMYAGAGIGEGGIALGNIGGNVMEYLARKGLVSEETAKKSLHIPDLGVEKALGIDNPDKGDQFIKMLGSFLIPGKVAKSFIPGKAAFPAAAAAIAAGENQDPLQGSLQAMLMQRLGGVLKKTPGAAITTAKAIPEVISNLPEHAGSAASSILESTADYASKIPGIGGVAQPTLGAIASALKHYSVKPEELAQRNLFGDIESSDLPEIKERNAAGKRLGLTYLTPSELLNSPFESAKQGNIGRTSQGSKLLYKEGEAREASEEAAINRLLNAIHEDKLEPIKKAAYQETMKGTVSDDFIDRQTKRPVIQQAIKKLESNPAYRQKIQDELGVEIGKVKPNSFMYWDMVKRVLGDLGEKAKETGRPTTESDIYADTRRSMVNEMDAIKPEYKTARNIAERKFNRQKLEKVFDKKDKTFNNFDSFLKSKSNYTDMMQKLDAFPEAKQILTDIKKFSGKMIPNNPTIRANAALKRTGMSDARNAVEAKKRQLDEKYGTEHDVAAVKLMTHPDLVTKLIDYMKKTGK